MKKILWFIPIVVILIFIMIITVVNNQMESAVSILTFQNMSGDNDKENGTCSYNNNKMKFSKEVEEYRSQIEQSVYPYLTNLALAMLEHDKTLTVEKVIAIIDKFDNTIGVDENLQNYKYDYQYSEWLKKTGKKHSLSASKQFFTEQWKQQDKKIYSYYLEVLSIINKDCKVIVPTGKWVKPMERPFVITQDYGITSITGTRHNGIDFSKEKDAPIYASTDGKVVSIEKECDAYGGYLGNMCGIGGQGNHVVIETKNEDKTIYVVTMHMARVDVNMYDEVVAGQKIGTQGNSGNTTGSHCHYEIRTTLSPTSNIEHFIDPHNLIDIYS